MASVVATISVQALTNNSADISSAKEVIPVEQFNQCERQKSTLQNINSGLESCKNNQKELHEFILPRPGRDRVLYLLGRSHGQRLEAIQRLHESQELTREIALQAEENYMENVLARDYNSRSFTKGKSRGQDEAITLLGIGEPKVLTGDDVGDMR